MGYLNGIEPSIPVRVRYPWGCVLDALTGRYHIGVHGDYILNGGIAPYTGIVGPPNMGKTALADAVMVIMAGYYESEQSKHDTEASATVYRTRDIARHVHRGIFEMSDTEIMEYPFLTVTDLSVYTCTEMYLKIREIADLREANAKNELFVTPFLDEHGKPISVMKPFGHVIDSLSTWISESGEEKRESTDPGNKKGNMYGMTSGSSKTQLIAEYPTMIARRGMMYVHTAHTGDKYQLDPMAASKMTKLAHMKNNIEIKFVSSNFHYLTNDLYWIMGSTKLLMKDSSGQKFPMYPLNKDDAMKDDTDLSVITVSNLRGKGGPSGVPVDLVISQSEGFHPTMSDFYHIKESDSGDKIGYGFTKESNVQNYQLALYPDVKLSRHSIRQKIDDDLKLRNAIYHTAQMCVMKERWKRMDQALVCTPQELYEDIKKLGYDWDRLLTARTRWLPDHYTNPVPPLSTMDLLRMRLGLYRPFWYDKS